MKPKHRIVPVILFGMLVALSTGALAEDPQVANASTFFQQQMAQEGGQEAAAPEATQPAVASSNTVPGETGGADIPVDPFSFGASE